ncbi:MAG: twin-arginine translocase TatA/TatE family subunit [Nitrososphaeria archaeon]
MLESATDLLIVIIVAVVLFAGANKIPEIFHSFGRAVGEYKKGKMESEMELSRMMQESPASTQQSPSPAAQRDERVRQLESQIAELQRQLEELKRGSGK